MRALRLAPLLLAVAACSVDVDSLKPKADAECAAIGQKACGNRCMPITAANGCGNPGCQPCPTPPAGYDAYCSSALTCQTRVACPVDPSYAARFAFCDGPDDTVCDDTESNVHHCGGCGHDCLGGTCANYACDTITLLPPSTNGPVDLGFDGTSVVWAQNDFGSAGTVGLFKDGAAVHQWTGHVDRLEADGTSVVLSSTRQGDPIVEVYESPSWVASTIFVPSSGVRAFAIDPLYAYVVELGSSASHETANDLVEVKRVPSTRITRFYYYDFSPSPLTAVAVENAGGSGRTVVGTGTGELRWVSYDLASAGLYASSIDPAVELVVFNGAVGATGIVKSYAFWVGESGNVYRRQLPAGSVENLTSWSYPTAGRRDLFADADGVYWVDSAVDFGPSSTPRYFGVVGEWRARHDEILPLYLSATGAPARVTATGSHVVWLDASGEILTVAK